MRTPDPAVFACLGPITVIIEIFGAPHIFVEVLSFVTEPLCEVTFSLGYPLIDYIARCSGEQVPITGVLASDDEFRGTSVAQRES